MIKEVTENLADYHLAKATRPLAEFINDLSTWWLRRSRDRFKNDQAAPVAVAVLEYALLALAQVAAPALPFLAERIYQLLRAQKVGLVKGLSVHLTAWPAADEKLIKEQVLAEMQQVRLDVEKGLALRAENKIKVRQPLLSFTVPSRLTLSGLLEVLQDELNVLEIKTGAEYSLETEITPELRQQGLVRELIRQINNLRKAQKLTVQDQVKIHWQTEAEEVAAVLADEKLAAEICQATAAVALQATTAADEAVKINEAEVYLKLEKV
jgi:isoleucyl-tRNA synthetase